MSWEKPGALSNDLESGCMVARSLHVGLTMSKKKSLLCKPLICCDVFVTAAGSAYPDSCHGCYIVRKQQMITSSQRPCQGKKEQDAESQEEPTALPGARE